MSGNTAAEREPRKTPLYDVHVAGGGRIVPFAGYLLPVQYEGVIAEHMAVRTKAGLFDVSHMGEVLFTGPDALANLQRLLTNDFTDMPDGRVRYSVMCNDDGGVVDDLVVCKFGPEKYLAVVNAANREKDVAWMQSHLFGNARCEDVSDGMAQIALQGPASRAILSRIADPEALPAKYYTFRDGVSVAGKKCLVSQTGYTGEFGYELYMPNEAAVDVWNALLEAGKDLGLQPAGLGARDTLRLEAGMPLYGHEMDETITPFEAGVGFVVKMEKDDFIGKHALADKGEPKRLRVGLRVTGRGIVRENEAVCREGREIGRTTSGTHCPYLGKAVAMALLEAEEARPGVEVAAQVRGRDIAMEVVPLPFYKRQK
jgi:glycine cleavage system T protein